MPTYRDRRQNRDTTRRSGDLPRDLFRVFLRLRFGLRAKDADLLYFMCQGYTTRKALGRATGMNLQTITNRLSAIRWRFDTFYQYGMLRPVWFYFIEVQRICGVCLTGMPIGREVGLAWDQTPLVIVDGVFFARMLRREKMRKQEEEVCPTTPLQAS